MNENKLKNYVVRISNKSKSALGIRKSYIESLNEKYIEKYSSLISEIENGIMTAKKFYLN